MSVAYLDTALLDVDLIRYVSIASAALLVYDHFLTLLAEVELIWRAKWSLGKLLFLCNRYCVPIVVALDMYQLGGLATNLTEPFCKGWVLTESYAVIISLAIINLVIAVRLHALWGGASWLRNLLAVAWVLYVAATVAITSYLMIAQLLPSLTAVPILDICYGDIPDALYLIWVPATIFELMTISLTAARAFYHSKQEEQTMLTHILYRDGFLYNAVKLIILLANVFVFAFASKLLVMLLKELVLVAVNVLGSRMILNLREVPLQKTLGQEDIELWSPANLPEWKVPPRLPRQAPPGIHSGSPTQSLIPSSTIGIAF